MRPVRSHEVARHHLTSRVPVGRHDETIAAVLAGLRGAHVDCADAVYVLDAAGRYAGLAPMAEVLARSPEATLGDVARHPGAAVGPDEDQERIAHRALELGIAAVPVADAEGTFLGVVPASALVEILLREHVEDLHRLAGIRREATQARDALDAPPARRARDRLPWLLVGLAGSALATLVMTRFERALQARVELAFFVPGIVYMADAVGTQTEAVAVRGLSLSRASLGHLLSGELRAGFAIGAVLGALAFPLVLVAFRDVRLAGAVALAVVSAGSVAAGVGLLFPWLLTRAGVDPAFGSGPLATIVQDVLSLLIYFGVVAALAR